MVFSCPYTLHLVLRCCYELVLDFQILGIAAYGDPDNLSEQLLHYMPVWCSRRHSFLSIWLIQVGDVRSVLKSHSHIPSHQIRSQGHVRGPS